MNSDRPWLSTSASTKAIVPLVGLFGGFSIGALRAPLGSADPISTLGMTLRAGIIGFFLGLAAVLVVSIVGRKDLISLRRLMVLVLAAAVLCWYALYVLFAVLG